MDNSIMDNSIFIKHNECYACVISLGSNYTDEFQTAIGYCFFNYNYGYESS